MENSEFRNIVKSVAHQLASDTGRNAAAVEKLIKQGRIIIVPSPGHLNINAQDKHWIISEEDNSVAYVFTDGATAKSIVNTLRNEVLPALSPEMHHIPWWRTLMRKIFG